jgi:hypothetical protein
MGDSSSRTDMIVVIGVLVIIFVQLRASAAARAAAAAEILARLSVIEADLQLIKAYQSEMIDFWHPSTRNLKAVTKRESKQRDIVSKYYGCLEEKVVVGKTYYLATCCVTGLKGIGD